MATPTIVSSGALIDLQNVTKVYGKRPAVHALKGIGFRVRRGDFVAVTGHSGSGKTTCMNILGCLDTPSKGTYRFEGVDVGALSRDQRALLRRHYIGFIFQGFNLLQRTSALENVELPLVYRGMPKQQRKEKAFEALTAVGLSGWEHHKPNELSGGQQQRVAIAQAIVSDPQVLLADEPTGNLDTARSRKIMELIARLNRERGLTIFMVTHDAEMAEYARRKIHFLDGQIELIQSF